MYIGIECELVFLYIINLNLAQDSLNIPCLVFVKLLCMIDIPVMWCSIDCRWHQRAMEDELFVALEASEKSALLKIDKLDLTQVGGGLQQIWDFHFCKRIEKYFHHSILLEKNYSKSLFK